MSKETGGPAFPVKELPYSSHDKQGMTLRDYFAAKAMQGRFAGIGKIPNGEICDFEIVAKQAYSAADAMLKVREQ